MDKSGEPGPSQQPQKKNQTSNRGHRNRQQVERDVPYKDLRELLNHKRQTTDGKNGGPPSDPKYNYLSDPMRDADSSNTSNTNTSNVSTSRFPNQRSNFRNPSSRGRGRGNYAPEKTYHQKPGPEPTKFQREWDQGKEDPRNRRYNNPQYSEPQHYINPNYKGPPHKYIPNYRGGQRYPPRRYQQLDPVNISVEYNVEDGFRKCTALDVKLDKTWKKGQNKKQIQQKQQQPEQSAKTDEAEEENWDEDVVVSSPDTKTKADAEVVVVDPPNEAK